MTDRVIPFSTASQAYRASQPAPVRPVSRSREVGSPAARQEQRDSLSLSAAARQRAEPSHPLAAAKVPGPVAFDGVAPARTSGSLPIYAHPADRNAAATGIHAGRLIDTQA